MKIKLLIVMSIALASCGHHRDVRPGTRGFHRVIVEAEDTTQGQRNAISQANHYCEQFKKTAAFENESSKYTGKNMDEKSYRQTKMLSKAARQSGRASDFNASAKQTRRSEIGTFGRILDNAVGNGYTVDMTFKCI